MSTIASNTETESSKSTRARWPTTIDYGNNVERINQPRAQKRSPPPVAGTEARAFNVATMLPPNPTVTRSVIGEQAPVKSPLFRALSSRLEKSTNRHSIAGVISHRDPPRELQGQCSCVTDPPVPPDSRADALLPREGSSDGSQRFNHSRHDYCHDVQACARSSQYQTMYTS